MRRSCFVLPVYKSLPEFVFFFFQLHFGVHFFDVAVSLFRSTAYTGNILGRALEFYGAYARQQERVYNPSIIDEARASSAEN